MLSGDPNGRCKRSGGVFLRLRGFCRFRTHCNEVLYQALSSIDAGKGQASPDGERRRMAVECAIVLPIMQVFDEKIHVSNLRLYPVTSDRSPEAFPHPAPPRSPVPYRLVDLASRKMSPNSDDDDDGEHDLRPIF